MASNRPPRTENDSKPDADAGAAGESEQSFEEELKRLEQTVRELEQGELPLEEALARYEHGVARLRRCYQMLEAAEAKIEQLVEKADGSLSTKPIDVETTDASARPKPRSK